MKKPRPIEFEMTQERLDELQRNPAKQKEIPFSTYIGKPEKFIEEVPKHLRYDGSEEIEFILLVNNENYFAYLMVLHMTNSYKIWNTLYYWKKKSEISKIVNRELNIDTDLRWADNYTYARSKRRPDYLTNWINYPLGEIGVNLMERFH